MTTYKIGCSGRSDVLNISFIIVSTLVYRPVHLKSIASTHWRYKPSRGMSPLHRHHYPWGLLPPIQDNSPRGVRDHQFRALRRLSIPNFSSNPQTNASHDKTRLFTQERTILRERTLFLPHSQVLKPATGWVWPGVARIKTAVNLITGKLNSTRQQKGPGHAKN